MSAITTLSRIPTLSINIPSSSMISENLKGLAKKAKTSAAQYLKLCAEYQRLSKNGYVPESFYEKFIQFTKEESEVLVNKRVESLYKELTSEDRIKNHLEISATIDACDKKIEVPGDGNCGLHSLAIGLVHQGNEEVLKKLKEEINQQPNSSNKTIVLDGIERLRTTDRSRLLNDRVFMNALTKILREIGHKQVPLYFQSLYTSLSKKEKKVIQELIPAKNGEWVSAEGIIALAKILKMEVCIDVRNNRNENERVFLHGESKKPDFVIRHKGSHFTPFLKRAPSSS